ncbi:MAG: hypothetical protein COW03_07150 [Cytophagales bacterium CG12_big_fil_rev_8_21_14_0_65_40_12]|nr:MAG: hypothetical protein COW03_07150 [Cytophagales bacterium CG12_big_fil_rev_8_21_14_0_65_40_12]PIW06182.1 MAG: hypothetical protein COW40_00545 [Cytophagales bacterium CG17_big_fil_post_rev_8_21_14_2_50_40_13]
MRLYKIFFTLAFLTPLLTLSLDGFIYTKKEAKSVDVSINDNWLPGAEWVDWTNGMSYKTIDYGKNVWMTKNFEIGGELMDLATATQQAPEGWRVPTVEEWKILLAQFGFGGDPNSLIPSAYYTFDFKSAGHVDPVLGLIEVGESGMFLALSEDGEGHSILIADRELNYKEGVLPKGAKLAVRYVRK